MPPVTTAARWVADARSELGDMIDDTPSVRCAHSCDAWPLAVKRARAGIPQVFPAAVAFPKCTEDVVRVLRWAASHGVEVVPWGAGSSVTGAPLPDDTALSLDMRGLDGILDLDRESFRVRVGAGVLGGRLESALEGEGLTTRFSPQSLHRSTVGGWVATRATGQYSSRWGGIEDAVVGLTVVLGDGKVVALGTPPRGAVGPNLVALFLGSEGTYGVVTEVTLRVFPSESLLELDAYRIPNLEVGVELLRTIAASGVRPALLRLYDAEEARYLTSWNRLKVPTLLCAFTGPSQVARAEHDFVDALAARAGAQSVGPLPTEAWLERRFDHSRIEALLNAPGGYAETIEIAHGWRDILATYQELKRALTPHVDEVLGHFSHVYPDGTSLYLIVAGHAGDDAEAVRRLETVWAAAMAVALRCGAVISHHHGVGLARAPFLGQQLGGAYELLRLLKEVLDPTGTLHRASLGLGSAGPGQR